MKKEERNEKVSKKFQKVSKSFKKVSFLNFDLEILFLYYYYIL
tara:strand:+ start:62 stop:190 length:129 start_codon:yes stop_codon:yes gene_type:complete